MSNAVFHYVVYFTVCLLIEKLSLSKMPFKNDPVIGKFLHSANDSMGVSIFVLYSVPELRFSNVMALFSVGWQSLIDDTIKNLHQVSSTVKDSIVVRYCYPYHCSHHLKLK